jgi:hypothetical protein
VIKVKNKRKRILIFSEGNLGTPSFSTVRGNAWNCCWTIEREIVRERKID